MTKAIRISQVGGPDVMEWVDIDLPAPAAGQVQIKQEAVGLNFIDIYHRTGLYPVTLPSGLGMEGAGTITATGDGVTGFAPGDRVAYCVPPLGAYAEARNIPAKILVKLPDAIAFETAAAATLKGFTAYYLLRRTFAVKPGHTILFHAAAGGVGLIAGQWAKHLGATVIGTAGGPDKAALARAHGYDHVIDSRSGDLVAEVKALTGGQGVDVVYDSIGKDTFGKSIACLKRLGMMASFGNASGPVKEVDIAAALSPKSLFLTRPGLLNYFTTPQEFAEAGEALFGLIASGVIRIEIGQTYALKDAAQAHRDLEGRKTTGSTVLRP